MLFFANKHNDNNFLYRLKLLYLLEIKNSPAYDSDTKITGSRTHGVSLNRWNSRRKFYQNSAGRPAINLAFHVN